MELTQSNPQMGEEDLDGDDYDVMGVFSTENDKYADNLEGKRRL